jgi:hypothetical protein
MGIQRRRYSITRHFFARFRFWSREVIRDERYCAVGYWLGVGAAFVWRGTIGLLIGWFIAAVITFFTG